ncbi:MAG: hypothetical protein Q8933_08520 [Bacteroidota bacterium]|nr:hypothetical protein [Bacteroidota bacterium]MDP4190311.1 hypothetical protein [Bacteroidota bacterium]MDP4196874.1 hypothetical protein [Bacteroidota bacterium]
MLRSAKAIQENLDQIKELKLEVAQKTSDDNTDIANTATKVMVILIILGITGSMIIGLFIANKISRPLVQ